MCCSYLVFLKQFDEDFLDSTLVFKIRNEEYFICRKNKNRFECQIHKTMEVIIIHLPLNAQRSPHHNTGQH